MAVRQDRMVEVPWREDLTLDEPKVLLDVGVTRLGDEGRMAFRVDTGFVNPRVQRGDIDVMDLLVGGHLMVQFHGIGTTPTESVAGIQRFCELKVSHKRTDVRGGVLETFPFTFPHLHYGVPLLSKVLDLLLGGLVDILHGPIIVAYMCFVAVRVTAGTSMGETTLKFVHGPGVVAVTIHEANGRDANLAGIAGMLNVLLLGTPGQPFQGHV